MDRATAIWLGTTLELYYPNLKHSIGVVDNRIVIDSRHIKHQTDHPARHTEKNLSNVAQDFKFLARKVSKDL